MRKIIVFIGFALLLLWIFGIFSKKDSGAILGKPVQDITFDGRELFSLEEQKEENQDFVSGGMYLVLAGNDTKELRFLSYKDGLAVFLNSQNQEESFSSNVLVSFSEDSNVKDIENFFKKDKNVKDFELFDSVRTASVTFENPYQAYIKHLEYSENDLFTSVGLDFTVSAMQNVDIAL